MSNFKHDLEMSNRVELQVAQLFPNYEMTPQVKFDGDFWTVDNNGNKLLVEVKTQVASKETKNVAYEYYSFYDWTPRGLAYTKADIWIDVLWHDDKWLAVYNTVEELRVLLKELFKNRKLYTVARGDYNSMAMVLVRNTTILKLGHVLGEVKEVVS